MREIDAFQNPVTAADRAEADAGGNKILIGYY